MKSLLNFILNYHYFLLFILIEFFAVLLLFQNNNYQHATFINSSSKIAGGLYEKFYTISQYMGLKETNIELNEALALYRNNNTANSYNNLSILNSATIDTNRVRQYEFIPAQVINNSINKQNNFITLNVGKKQGVAKNMGVVSAFGTVGIVKDVSENYSSVISFLNQNLRISAMLKNSGHFGSLYWTGKDSHHARLIDLPNHLQIRLGDTVITSGYSAIFPKGETIGYVSEIFDTTGSFFLEVNVKLAVDFQNVSHVMVVRNFMRDEQIKLEIASNHDK